MLEFLRRNAQSVFFQAIVVVIILAFVFWGGSSMMNSRESAITVNKEEISFQEVDKAYNQTYETMAEQFGGQIPKVLADSLNIKGQVINQLIQDSLLRQGADDMGIMVSNDEVQKAITQMVQFQKNGVFNIESYKAILANNRMTPTKYEDMMKRDLLAQKTLAEIRNFATVTTDVETTDLYQLEKEAVSVDFISFKPASFIEKVDKSDEKLSTWFEQNKAKYNSEPQIKLQYLAFLFDAIGSKITISDDEIKNYYDSNIAKYQVPETRKASHILIKASTADSEDTHKEKRTKAEEILKLVKADDDFAKLAKTYSEDTSGPSGGNLGYFSQGRMVPEFDKAVFSMNKGEISAIIKTDFGYHIVKLDDVKTATTIPFNEVQKTILTDLQIEQAKPMAFQLANTAYEGIISSGSLAAYIAENSDSQPKDTDFFTQSAPPSELEKTPIFVSKAFELNKGELSSLIESDHGYMILFATDIKEPEAPEMATVKDTVTTDYIAEQAATLAKDGAQSFLTEVKGGKDFDVMAKERGMDVVNSGYFTKSTPNPDSTFPTSLIPQTFRLSIAEPLPEEASNIGTDWYVYQLKERNAPKSKIGDADKKRYETSLLQLKQQQLISAWLKSKQEGAEITIHKSLQ